jgi:membrane protease YdiL (CAAX protease family)
VTRNGVSAKPRAHRAWQFCLFLLCGLSIFLLGNNWNSLFPTNDSTLYKTALPVAFLAATLALRRSERFRRYNRIAYALFIGSFANALMWYLGRWDSHFVTASTLFQDLAFDKVAQMLPVVLSIVVLTRVAGDGLGSIYIRKGDLKQWLGFGAISFGVCAATFAVIAGLQAGGPSRQGLTASGISLDRILASIPWILVFVFANALMEEFWFRGIYLRQLEPFLGSTATALVTSLIFGLSHVGATYVSPVERFGFPIIVFALGLVGARNMQKSDSVWGSVLFHAGYDLIVILPVVASTG